MVYVGIAAAVVVVGVIALASIAIIRVGYDMYYQ